MHLAARVGAQGGPGEILVSPGVQAELSTAVRFRFGESRTTSFKGFEGLHEVIPVLWEDTADPRAEAAAWV